MPDYMNIEELYRLYLTCKGFSTDTRKLIPGSIFFALKGENFNGNEFAQSALDAGCSYAVIDEGEEVNHRIIKVNDVLHTLQSLANYHRRQFNIPVLGITGSNGKTTSKELIGAVLKRKFNVLITEGNLNNHLGVPFTLLRLKEDHEVAIIEMGASKPGDIKELVEIAEPDLGIITNIGAAHIEGFGSLEGVIMTKTELYDYLAENGGLVFYNAEDEILVNKLPVNTEHFSYGTSSADVVGVLENLTPFVQFSWASSVYQSGVLNTNLVGRYNFTNFLAAAAVGTYFKVSGEEISAALSEYEPSNKRSQVTNTDRNTLIVDCYNANATSMTAALESFIEVNHPKKIVILGDMLELGHISGEEHQRIIDLIRLNGLEGILVGKEFAARKSTFKSYNNVDDLLKAENLGELNNSLILLKGSRGIRLESLLEYL